MKKPIHVAITRTVKPGCEASFEKAILTFFADSQKNEATLGAQLLRPLPGDRNRIYGILRSFDSEQRRDAFYDSENFKHWQREVAPLVEDGYSRREFNGLEAFFKDPERAFRPPLWKMAIVTWLGVWPTVLVVALLGRLVLPSSLPFMLAVGLETLLVVVILTWGVMPILTCLSRSWLMPPRG